jgi:hypothetical protein
MKLTKPNVGSDGEALNMMIEMYRSDLRSLSDEFSEKDRQIEESDKKKLGIGLDSDDDDVCRSHTVRRDTFKTLLF